MTARRALGLALVIMPCAVAISVLFYLVYRAGMLLAIGGFTLIPASIFTGTWLLASGRRP